LIGTLGDYALFFIDFHPGLKASVETVLNRFGGFLFFLPLNGGASL